MCVGLCLFSLCILTSRIISRRTDPGHMCGDGFQHSGMLPRVFGCPQPSAAMRNRSSVGPPPRGAVPQFPEARAAVPRGARWAPPACPHAALPQPPASPPARTGRHAPDWPERQPPQAGRGVRPRRGGLPPHVGRGAHARRGGRARTRARPRGARARARARVRNLTSKRTRAHYGRPAPRGARPAPTADLRLEAVVGFVLAEQGGDF